MASSAEFDKLNTIYTAIRDIDKIIFSDSSEKIDDIIMAIKNIDKKEFDQENENKIIMGFRDALLKIYKDNIDLLNSNIESPKNPNNEKFVRPNQPILRCNNKIGFKDEREIVDGRCKEE